jgi:hypothetical protein
VENNVNIKKIALLILLATISIFAHRALLMVEDNDDGTIYIEGGISTGGASVGAKVVIVDKSTGRPLWQGILGEDGTIDAPQPKNPYLVKLMQSKGHVITVAGPLPIAEIVKDSSELEPPTSEKNESENIEEKIDE